MLDYATLLFMVHKDTIILKVMYKNQVQEVSAGQVRHTFYEWRISAAKHLRLLSYD